MIKYLYVANETEWHYPEQFLTKNNTKTLTNPTTQEIVFECYNENIPIERVYFSKSHESFRETIRTRLQERKQAIIQKLDDVPKFAQYDIARLVKNKIVNPYSVDMTYSECKMIHYMLELHYKENKEK